MHKNWFLILCLPDFITSSEYLHCFLSVLSLQLVEFCSIFWFNVRTPWNRIWRTELGNLSNKVDKRWSLWCTRELTAASPLVDICLIWIWIQIQIWMELSVQCHHSNEIIVVGWHVRLHHRHNIKTPDQVSRKWHGYCNLLKWC